MKAVARGKAKAGKVVPKKPSKKELEAAQKAEAKKAEIKLYKPIELLPGMPKLNEDQLKERAAEIDKQVRRIDHTIEGMKVDFVEMGYMLIDMEQYALHRFIQDPETKAPYKNMTAWLNAAAPFSQSAGLASKRAVSRLVGYVPKEELKEFPQYAIKALAEVPAEKRSNPKLREKAKAAAKAPKGQASKKARQDFFKEVEKVAPEAHVEDSESVHVPKSVHRLFSRVVEIGKWLGETDDYAEALDCVLNIVLDAPCEIEQYSAYNNAVAFEEYQAELNRNAAPEIEEEEESAGEVLSAEHTA